MPGDADAATRVGKLLAVDTSVAVPLLMRAHEAHERLVAWRDGRPVRLCGHAWIETYAVLTRLPGDARVAPEDAVVLLASNFDRPLVPDGPAFEHAPQHLASAGIGGGAVYDGWVAMAALRHGARLASRDRRAEATYRRLGVDVEMVS